MDTTSLSVNDDRNSTSKSKCNGVNKYPFDIMEKCDAGYPQLPNQLTTRTEVSTDLDEISVQQRFSFVSTSLYTANGEPSTPYAMSFESNAARCPSTQGRGPVQVDIIDTSGSYEIISELSVPKERRCGAYESSLLDLEDEDDVFESESMFIGASDVLDTESKMNFYSSISDAIRDGVSTKVVRNRLHTTKSTGSMFNASDDVLDTESRFGFYQQGSLMTSNRSISVNTDSRDDFNVVNDAEEPPSCREKVGPVLSFTEIDEFDWLTQATMKNEAKTKEQRANNVFDCGEKGSGVASNFRSFVSRCGSCFSPP